MEVPSISETDLFSFHASHFSAATTAHFSLHFLGPVDAEEVVEGLEEEVDEDDGLGYYADGVKRTLTDEQIAIFRHSEIQALLRELQSVGEERNAQAVAGEVDSALSEDGEVEEHVSSAVLGGNTPTAAVLAPSSPSQAQRSQTNRSNKRDPNSKKMKKAQKAKEKGWFKQQIKPDLRKRTWDVVEKGAVGCLEYDESEKKMIGPERPVQRRRVVYGDD